MKISSRDLTRTLLFFSPTLLFVFYIINQTYHPLGTNNNYFLSSQKGQLSISSNIQLLNHQDIDQSGATYFASNGNIFLNLQRVPIFNEKTFLTYTISPLPEEVIEYTVFRTDRFNGAHEREFLEWYPLTFPGYTTIAESEELSVLAKDSSYGQTTSIGNDLESWIEDNIPEFSSIGVSPGIDISRTNFAYNPTIQESLPPIHVPWKVRGTFGFYIKSKAPELNLSFIKEDINRYEGEDIYEIILTNLQEETVAYYTLYDDGIVDASYARQPQTINLSIPIETDGIYHLQFENNLSTKARQVSYDSSIHSLEINAQGIVSDGQPMLILEDTTIYSPTSAQKIFLEHRSTSNSINTTESLGQLAAEGNFRAINIPSETKISGYSFSTNPESYFLPFRYIFSQVQPDFWITHKDTVLPSTLVNSKVRNQQVGIGLRSVDTKGNNLPFSGINEIRFHITKPGILSF